MARVYAKLVSKREEFNLIFRKRDRGDWGIAYDCDGISQDRRSLFVSTILRGHDEPGMPELFLEEIEYAETGQFEEMEEFWQQTIDDMLNSGNLKIFTSADLPSGIPVTTFTEINGHIKFENLYFKRPASISSGGIEIPLGSGNFYKRKAKQYIINPDWGVQRLKEKWLWHLKTKS